MKILIAIALLLPVMGSAQNRNLGQFVTWKPKPGMEKQFEEGYKRHLEWHKNANDPWFWYGWYFISGPRTGQFMDASLDHSLADFDDPVDAAGDRADNEKNTMPYADVTSAMKLYAVTSLSHPGLYGIRAKYMKMITLQVLNDYSANWRIRNLKNRLENKEQLKFFITYKTFDGGRLDNWYILIGADSWEDFEPAIDAGERLMDSAVFRSITSETLHYRNDLSYLPMRN